MLDKHSQSATWKTSGNRRFFLQSAFLPTPSGMLRKADWSCTFGYPELIILDWPLYHDRAATSRNAWEMILSAVEDGKAFDQSNLQIWKAIQLRFILEISMEKLSCDMNWLFYQSLRHPFFTRPLLAFFVLVLLIGQSLLWRIPQHVVSSRASAGNMTWPSCCGWFVFDLGGFFRFGFINLMNWTNSPHRGLSSFPCILYLPLAYWGISGTWG